MHSPTRWIAYALQVLLALLFAFSATMKLTGGMDDVRDLMGVAPWFWTVAALWQALGAMALIAGLRSAVWAVAGALWLAVVMAGAVLTHVVTGQTGPDIASPIVLLAVVLIVARVRWPEARIGSLIGRAVRRSAPPQAIAR